MCVIGEVLGEDNCIKGAEGGDVVLLGEWLFGAEKRGAEEALAEDKVALKPRVYEDSQGSGERWGGVL